MTQCEVYIFFIFLNLLGSIQNAIEMAGMNLLS
jgi:hypothetical protein